MLVDTAALFQQSASFTLNTVYEMCKMLHMHVYHN